MKQKHRKIKYPAPGAQPYLKFVAAVILASIVFVLPSSPAFSGKEKADPILCKKAKISSRGRPNSMRAMASMNSVIQWIHKAKKEHGDQYALWHAAFDPKISCDKIKGPGLYICFAAAKPCRLKTKEEEEAERKKKEAENNS